MQSVAIAADTQDLFCRLQESWLGFSPRNAATILATYSRSAIEAELANLPNRRGIENPAGFLLAALKAGDFVAPKIQPKREFFHAPADFQLPQSTPSPSVSSPGRPFSAPDSGSLDPVPLILEALDPHVRAQFILEARRLAAKELCFPLDRVKEYNPVVEVYLADLVAKYGEEGHNESRPSRAA
jgi:hypothetical protein